MRHLGFLALLFAIAGAQPSAAREQTVHSVDEFVAATSSCLSALAAASPEETAEALEGDGWEIEKATAIGGIFRQNKNSIRIKFENFFGIYVCTVLGNRQHPNGEDPFAGMAKKALEENYPDRVSTSETSSSTEILYVIDGQFKVVLTLEGVRDGFDTKFTTIKSTS